MREATDLGVSAGVRRELSGRRIDLTKLKFPVKSGIITIEGELSFVGMEKSTDETAIELKFLESSLRAINGAKDVIFCFSNWNKNEAGVWESTEARVSGISSTMPTGEGLFCPDCDFVIRFCPCCGKPLAGAGKASSSKTRKPVPPIKPVIKKKKPPIPGPTVAPAPAPTLNPTEAKFQPPRPAETEEPSCKPVVPPPEPAFEPFKEQTDQPSIPQTAPLGKIEEKPSTETIPEKIDLSDIAIPVAEPEKKDQQFTDIPKFDENAFDLSASPVTPAQTPVVPQPQAQAPDFSNLDITNFTEPVASEAKPEAKTSSEDPFGYLGSDLNVDLNEPSIPPLTTTPASPEPGVDLCNFAPEPEEALPAAPEPMETPAIPVAPAPEPVPAPTLEPVPAPAAPAAPAEPEFSLSEALDLEEDDTPLPPMKPAAPEKPATPPVEPFSLLDEDDTPLPPMKPASQPAQPQSDPFNLDDDDTPLPPMKPAATTKPASKDPFAALFADAGNDLSGKGGEKSKDPFASLDLDLDVLEVFPSTDSNQPTPPAPKPAKPAAPAQPADDNPFNLDNVIDLDSPVDDDKKGKKDPFDLDDFDISKFKI